MFRKISYPLAGLFAALFLLAQMTTAAQISISIYSGSSYIPTGQSSVTNTFQVVASGLSSDVYYGYQYKVDGGDWSAVVYPYIGWGIGGSSTQYLQLGLGDGAHTIYVRLLSYDGAFWTILTDGSTGRTIYLTVTVQNSYGGGNVTVDGGSYSSPATFYWHSGQNHTLTATDGVTYSGFLRDFENWTGDNISGSGTQVTATIDGADVYTAVFHIDFQIIFQNSYPGYGTGGVINVNSTQYNSPTSTFLVDESASITGGVVSTSQTINYVLYTFNSWSPGGSPNATQQFTPADNITYSANFAAKPNAPTNVQAGGAVNENVVVSWTDNPNADVTQYRIWRKTKHGSDAQVATVSSGVGSWTDQDFIITGTSSDSMLTYSVYSYYSPSGTLSDPASQVAWATFSPRIEKPALPAFHEANVPSSFTVGSYPNPFNPSTTIAYTLPEEASIRLDVFDMTGRMVKTLLGGSRSSGYYKVVWNGKDDTGNDVSSGVYIYQFVATPSDPEKAFRQSGKLILTR